MSNAEGFTTKAVISAPTARRCDSGKGLWLRDLRHLVLNAGCSGTFWPFHTSFTVISYLCLQEDAEILQRLTSANLRK